MIGHGLMGTSLVLTATDVAQGRAHCERALALYNAAEHRALAARFGQDVRVTNLAYRSLALWVMGYPEAALADLNQAMRYARDTGEAATLMFTLGHAPLTLLWTGNYVAAVCRHPTVSSRAFAAAIAEPRPVPEAGYRPGMEHRVAQPTVLSFAS